jgi:hypothetical protein
VLTAPCSVVRVRVLPAPCSVPQVSVPSRDPNEAKTDYVALFGAVAQILASTIAIIVVLRR